MKANVVNVKKVTAVAIAFLMMILSVVYANSKSDAANSAIRYRIFNAKTGVQIGNDYVLNMRNSENNSRAVIGDDERVIDWTKSGVVKIMDSYGGFSSGFVVGNHIIATNAHCVYEYETNTPSTLSEILLFDKNGNVTLKATPVEYHIPLSFINYATYGSYNIREDYALITVKEDLSDYACFNLGVPLDSFVNSHSVVTITGFPRTFGKSGEETIVNTSTKHMMYSGNGLVCGGDYSLIDYNADISIGNSGGPVYITESAYGETYYTVVAINAATKDDTHNTGVRIDSDVLYFYSANNKKY